MAAIATGGSGNWSSTTPNAPWAGGTVPAEGDTVQIGNGHAVTIDQTIVVGADSATPALDVLSGGSLLVSNPAASYILTLKGNMYVRSGGILTIDMSTQPTYLFTIKANYSASLAENKYKVYFATGSTVTITGDTRTVSTTLGSQAASGQADLITTSDLSADWKANDIVWVADTASTGSCNQAEVKTVQSVAGTTVTLTVNLANTHASGAKVINLTRNILFTYYNATYKTQYQFLSLTKASVNVSYLEILGGAQSAYITAGTFTGLSSQGTNGANYPMTFPDATIATAESITMTSCVFYGGATAHLLAWRAAKIYNSFIIAISGNESGMYIYLTGNVDMIIDNCFFQQNSSVVGGLGLYRSVRPTVTNCTFSHGFLGIKGFGTYKPYLSGNTVEYHNQGYYMAGQASDSVLVDGLSINDTLVNNASNVPSIYADLLVGGMLTMTFDNLTYTNILEENGLIPDYTPVLNLRFQTERGVANTHRVRTYYGIISSTGDGLTDTTVHTSGSGKFGARFAPSSSVTNLEWVYDIPTGNIQNKTMTVAIWVKIAVAAYYAGTHEKPRLTIDYDNGTTTYAEALGNTDWQLVAVSFTPTTTFGQITVTISGRTDATPTNNYFYVDDVAVLYPAGYKLDLGGMDLWANGLPITPPIATVLSAKDVWTAASTEDYGANTMGNKVKGIKNQQLLLGGQIIV